MSDGEFNFSGSDEEEEDDDDDDVLSEEGEQSDDEDDEDFGVNQPNARRSTRTRSASNVSRQVRGRKEEEYESDGERPSDEEWERMVRKHLFVTWPRMSERMNLLVC